MCVSYDIAKIFSLSDCSFLQSPKLNSEDRGRMLFLLPDCTVSEVISPQCEQSVIYLFGAVVMVPSLRGVNTASYDTLFFCIFSSQIVADRRLNAIKISSFL